MTKFDISSTVMLQGTLSGWTNGLLSRSRNVRGVNSAEGHKGERARGLRQGVDDSGAPHLASSFPLDMHCMGFVASSVCDGGCSG